MPVRLHHHDELDEVVAAYERGERFRHVPEALVRAAHRRQMGGRGCRGSYCPGGGGPVYLLDYADATFTRSSEAAAVDPRTGWAFYDLATPWPGVDVARIMSDGAILVEGARTNVDTQARDFSTWTGSNAAVTTGSIDGPDGITTTGDLIEATSATSPKITKATGLSSGAVTLSVYLRRATWSGTVTIALTDGTTTVTAGLVLSDTWQRVTVTLPSAASAVTAEIRLGADATADCYADLVQVEAGAFSCSPIRTPGVAATRAGDQPTVPAGSWDALANASRFVVDVWPEFASTMSPPAGTQYHVFSPGGTVRLLFRWSGSNWEIRFSNSAGTSIESLSVAWAAYDNLRITCDHTSGLVLVENVTTGTADTAIAASAAGGSWAGYAGLDLHVGQSTSTNHLHGVLGRPEAA